MAKALALEYDAIFLPFQQIFIEGCKKTPLDYWIWDRVHTMPAGHVLMTRQWLKVVSKKINF
ncbi:MAG: hypothetical protein K9I84_01190 [Leadbetterella sp.]|nr:hypothetical protein [Leadbetterella sp.]